MLDLCAEFRGGKKRKGKGRYLGTKEKMKIEKNNTFIQIYFYLLAALCQIYCSGQLKSSLKSSLREFFSVQPPPELPTAQ